MNPKLITPVRPNNGLDHPNYQHNSYVWGVICGKRGRTSVKSKSSGWKCREAFLKGVVVGVQIRLRKVQLVKPPKSIKP